MGREKECVSLGSVLEVSEADVIGASARSMTHGPMARECFLVRL